MPLQFIHTSAPHLLDSNSAGYGTVARSAKLSKAICTRLTALSIMREPRGGAATSGPQFSYNIIDHAGAAWHVLTCVQSAGADYSGRICHIAHHLILSQDEVRTMHASSLRPTPAGVTLALFKSGFWCQKWEGEPRFLTGDPVLKPDDLPDASAQPTWKKLTGHKANARAFFTPPYDRDCLVTVTPGITSADVLRLFHESDWLTHSRGWGVTYTTVADDADSFAETLRMVTTPQSPLVQRAIRTGHPVLAIEQGLELPLPPPATEAPLSEPISPASKSAQGGAIVRTLSRSVSHYHYTEEPDWLLYDIKPPSRSKYYIQGVAATLAVAMLASAAWYYYTPAGSASDDDSAAYRETVVYPDNVQELSALLRSEYNHEATIQLLNRLSSIAESCPEDALLVESAAILQGAGQKDARHASAIKRLCECARLLGLKDTDLALLYFREATFATTPEEWKQQFNGEQIADWITLKQTEPLVIELLGIDELKAYRPTAEPATATILATADSAPIEPEEEQQQPPQPGRVSLIPSTAVTGATIPNELERIIPGLPISISTGTYAVSCFAEGGELQPARRLDLSENGFRLYITPTETPGEFLLKPEHTEGMACPVPATTLTLRNGRVQSIRTENREAVVSFPVPAQEEFHTNIILASSFGIPLPQGKGISLPPASKANLEMSPDTLEIIPSSVNSKVPKLRINHKKSFPWSLSKGDTERIRFTIKLPVLTGHNSMQQAGSDLPTYTWAHAEVVKEVDDITTILCEVEHRPDLPGRLERAFDLVANSTCCGEYKVKNESMTLGHLYYICCALANDKLSRREKRELHRDYFDLFANKQFNKVLMRLFANDTILHLTPEEARSNHFKALQIRNNIKEALDNRSVRDLIRKRICEVLTRTLYAAYTQEQRSLEEKKQNVPVFILKDIKIGNHVELLWQFRMQMNEK